MKNYLLTMYHPGGGTPAPDFLAKVMKEVGALRNELKTRGEWVFGDGLHSPTTATVVRLQGAEVLTTDGPYAEGKEHIGGLTIIRAPDLDAALQWAGRYARATTLPVEVRPFRTEAEG
jgi:hypothetical protein